jgi:hypothetical protein
MSWGTPLPVAKDIDIAPLANVNKALKERIMVENIADSWKGGRTLSAKAHVGRCIGNSFVVGSKSWTCD